MTESLSGSQRGVVLRPSRKCVVMGLLGWPIPLAAPALVVLVAGLIWQDWLLAVLSAACVVLVTWRVLQVRVFVGRESLTVFNPWGRTEISVGPSTRIGLDGTVSFSLGVALGLGVFEGDAHVVGIVASSYPSAASVEAWTPVLRDLAVRTGCAVEVPGSWTSVPR